MDGCNTCLTTVEVTVDRDGNNVLADATPASPRFDHNIRARTLRNRPEQVQAAGGFGGSQSIGGTVWEKIGGDGW
jgi:hypothetical protein